MYNLLSSYFFLLIFFQTSCSETLCKKSCPDKKETVEVEVIIETTQKNITEQDIALFEKFWDRSIAGLSTDSNSYTFYQSPERLYVRAINKDSKVLLGLALCKKVTFPEQGLSLDYLCVEPSFQRQGIGTKIIKNLIETCRPAQITLVSVAAAVPFYEKLGFTAPKGVGKISALMEKNLSFTNKNPD